MYKFIKKRGYLLISGFGHYWDNNENQLANDPLVREGNGRIKWKDYLDQFGKLGHNFSLEDDARGIAGLTAFKDTDDEIRDEIGRPSDRLFIPLTDEELQRSNIEKLRGRNIDPFRKKAWRLEAKLRGEI